jgi:hypothetical protein
MANVFACMLSSCGDISTPRSRKATSRSPRRSASFRPGETSTDSIASVIRDFAAHSFALRPAQGAVAGTHRDTNTARPTHHWDGRCRRHGTPGMALALTQESRFVARLEDVAACSPLMSALVVEARFTIGSNVSEFLSWRHDLNATCGLSPGYATCPRTLILLSGSTA